MDPETATAIISAVILHRASVESEVRLLENGDADEGFWGRSGRAGTASVLTHRPRRTR
jgi:hypothetical protein